jgi:hypothetical protein
MGILERMVLVKRVVIPGDKRYHYIPVTHGDSLRGDMIANIRQNLQCILTALDRTEADLKAWENPDLSVIQRIEEVRHFYRQNDKLLDLISRHNTGELIQLLETSF